MSLYAVFDIDGVLADVRHRLEHVRNRPKNWDLFFGRAYLDQPLAQGRALMEQAISSGLKVVYSTGRPERCRADTITWLTTHGFPRARLHMRADTDRRPGRMTKLAVARRLRDAGGVAYCVDDDPVVVEALRADGFRVVHATWMGETDSPTAHQDEAQQLLFDLQDQGEF